MRRGRGCGTRCAPGPADRRGHRGVQQLRDLLECVWPAVLSASVSPFEAKSWCAALGVVLDRGTGHPERLARLGLARFEAAVRREMGRWVAKRLRAGSWPRCSPRWPTRPGSSRSVQAHSNARVGVGRLALDQDPTGRDGNPDGRHARRVELTELVTIHPRDLGGRGGSDPGRDRRPDPVRHPPSAGQTRRAVPAGEQQRHRHRPVAALRRADPGCDWPPGARCGPHYKTIR